MSTSEIRRLNSQDMEVNVLEQSILERITTDNPLIAFNKTTNNLCSILSRKLHRHYFLMLKTPNPCIQEKTI